MAMEYALSMGFSWRCPPEVYSVTGAGLSVASGRLSFVFGFTGPAISVDTACSSSLVGLHLAHKYTNTSKNARALSCGSNALVSRKTFEYIHRAGMLAVDGRCKTLDASANGYTRSESVQVLLLAREDVMNGTKAGESNAASVAVLGGAVNQDGRSASLTAPSGPAQQEMLQQALEDSAVGMHDLVGIQMHGTGTLLGDPIEIGALSSMLLDNHSHSGQDTLIALSGIKSTIGHAEAAAGLNGVIQAVSVLTQSRAAPFIHLRNLNPYLHNAFEGLKQSKEGVSFVAPRQPGQCTSTSAGGVHGVSAFAFQGTNVHILMKSLDCFGSREAVKVWRHKFFWYSYPTHPLLSTFATTSNIHNDLVAEARVDLGSPHLSYLRQFKLGNQSILGASVYIEAAGSLVSSLVSESADGAHSREYALTNATLGFPRVLEPQTDNSPVNHFRCHVDMQTGFVVFGDVERLCSRADPLVRDEFACTVTVISGRQTSAEKKKQNEVKALPHSTKSRDCGYLLSLRIPHRTREKASRQAEMQWRT
jgi:3-oxoacyl-(acyl-carrier-protein) synthase